MRKYKIEEKRVNIANVAFKDVGTPGDELEAIPPARSTQPH
jgi:hypothetical protein